MYQSETRRHSLRAVRRLYSTFAQGPPGIGVLLIRLVVGITAIVHGASGLHVGPALGFALFHAVCLGLGFLLMVGLWTPIAGTVLALAAFWNAFAHPQYRWFCVEAGTLGAALALLGPGRWSVDAHLFGWKRLEIRDRKQSEPPPEQP